VNEDGNGLYKESRLGCSERDFSIEGQVIFDCESEPDELSCTRN
jgi:hypothetical protein